MWVKLASAEAQAAMPAFIAGPHTRAAAGTWVDAEVCGSSLKLAGWNLMEPIVTEYWVPEDAPVPALAVLAGARRVPTAELTVTEVFDVPLRCGDYVYGRPGYPATYTVAEVLAAKTSRQDHRIYVAPLADGRGSGYLTPEMFAPGPGRTALWPDLHSEEAVAPPTAPAEPCLRWASRRTPLEPGCSWITTSDHPVPVALLRAAVERRRQEPTDDYTIPDAAVHVSGEAPLPFRRGYITPKMFEPSPERDAFFAWARGPVVVVPFDVDAAEYRVGFELETQRSLGRVFADLEPADESAVISALQDMPRTWLARVLPSLDVPLTATLESMLTLPAVIAYTRERLPKTSAQQRILDKVAADGRELEVKPDGSVSGFEFTTCDGGLPLAEAKDVARYVLDPSWAHEIDERCSFHIHVSSTTKHPAWTSASTKFQLACMEYLAVHLDEVPAAVRARWQSARQRSSYFSLECNTAKRKCFVAWRGATWEFRCWGNVSTAEDAERCLDLTVRAFKYACKRAQGARSLSPRVTLDKVKAAIESNTPLARRVRRAAPSAA